MMVLLATLMEHAGRMVQASLMVIGATFVGAFAIGFVGNLIAQTLTSKKLPPTMLRLVRVLGGLSTGFVVSMFVFNGSGGWGLGGGTGTGSTGAGLTAQEKAVAGTPQPTPASDATVNRVGVTLLGGGRVVAGKFYFVDGQPNAKNLAELQELVKSAKQPGPGHLVLRIYDDSIAQDHPAVVELENWLARPELACHD